MPVGDQNAQEPSPRSKEIHEHLVEIDRRLGFIIELVDKSLLADRPKSQLKGIFEGVRKVCHSTCEGPKPASDYYPELE